MYFPRPEYLLQPSKLGRRVFGPRSIPDESAVVSLPWGVRITVRRGDAMSETIWQTGVYDLALSEVIWRLLDPGEQALDVGANIGYVSSLMAARGCRVTSFEPHPGLFGELAANAVHWPGVTPLRVGLSASAGCAFLEIPEHFAMNRGIARLGASGTQIETETLDAYPATFAKVDVEGFEDAVFRGGPDSLGKNRLRDVVFEDFNPYPSPAMKTLLDYGYALFRIDKSFFGPLLGSPDQYCPDLFNAPNFLATTEPSRAKDRIRPRGWRVLL